MEDLLLSSLGRLLLLGCLLLLRVSYVQYMIRMSLLLHLGPLLTLRWHAKSVRLSLVGFEALERNKTSQVKPHKIC